MATLYFAFESFNTRSKRGISGVIDASKITLLDKVPLLASFYKFTGRGRRKRDPSMGGNSPVRKSAADEMATPEQLLQAIPNRNGYVLVEHARPPGSDFGHYGSSAPATSKFVLGELQRILNQPRFSSIDLRDQVSGDLSKLVGSGNYGLVHEGTMGAEHKRVAVKVVRYGDKSALPALERVLNEVYVWSKLKHNNVIELLGITTAFDHTISIVSPLMSHGNAFDYVQNPDVDPRPLILGIANGLHYLHTHEEGTIIHGDIKGPNVLISNDGHALLTDFGFSHLANASFSLAVEQHPGGTPDWMPPEYLDADQCVMTTAGDVWSFGMTALELFTRKRPFHRIKHRETIMYHILSKDYERPSPEVVWFRMTDEWWSLCLSCWARKPSERSSMSIIIEKIRSLQATPVVATHAFPSQSSRDISIASVFVNTDTGHTQLPLHATPPIHPGLLNAREALIEISRRASRDGINLDGRISKDTSYSPLGGHTVIHSDTQDNVIVLTAGRCPPQYQKAIKAAFKPARGGVPGDIDTIKRFLREVHARSKLCHANIIPLLGITTRFDQTVSVISPWMEKGNAFNYVQDKTVDPRPLIEGIAHGLHYLHNYESGPICHGDLKGVNVLISEDGQALLTNFGFSPIFMPSQCGNEAMVNWMSSQMFGSGKISVEADVWAFGMTALELFTCKSPFDYLHANIAEGHPPKRPSDADTCSRMTDVWWNMCFECWRPDPSSRPTMTRIVDQILKIMSSPALQQISKFASSYGVDVGGPIERDGAAAIFSNNAVVYQGRLGQEMETKVAVKVLLYSPPRLVDVVKRVLDDISAWRKLCHNNVLPVLGITAKFANAISLVSLWIERGNAHDYVQNNEISPVPLLLGIASGLRYLHAHHPRPIYHGNLRGHNALISHDGQALLTDTGLSPLLESSFIPINSAPHLQTVNWTSPEHLVDFKGSAKGDVWAFGMTALELFTRSFPFDDIKYSTQLKQRIAQGPPERPTGKAICSRLTDRWWNVFSSCWERDPWIRPSMEEVARRVAEEQFQILWDRDDSHMLQLLQQVA